MAQLLTVNYKSKPCYDIYISDSFQALPEKTEFLNIKEKKI